MPHIVRPVKLIYQLFTLSSKQICSKFMKEKFNWNYIIANKCNNILRIMKLSTFLLFLCFFSITAENTYPQQKELSFNFKNTTLRQAFSLIEKNSDYVFLVSDEAESFFNKKIDLAVKKESIGQVLSSLLENTDLGYAIVERQVFVYRKKEPDVIRKTEPDKEAPVNQPPPKKTITGTVKDINNLPVIGANVIETGTAGNGTATDVDGRFTLDVEENAVIRVSFIGYIVQEINTSGKNQFDITLLEETGTLDEVVVVAYGTQKKVTITGAVAAINTKEIKQSPAANLAVTLTGRLPGLIAIQRSGEPGRDAALLYMRGRGTLNGQDPLILVDGVERDLTSIDPNEVETISILKDASSTALFGVRGANGVILVTTKRGTSQIPDISLNAETGWQTFTRWPSSLDAYDWATLKNQAWHNDNPNPGVNDKPPYSNYALERYRLNDWPEVYGNHNWVKELMRQWVPQTRYNLTLNGKGSNVAYFVNVGYLHQGGQWRIDPEPKVYDPGSYMDRYNFRANIDATLNKKKTLKAFLNASGVFESVNGPRIGSTEIIGRILTRWPSVMPGPLTPQGEVLVGSGAYQESPWAQINRSGYVKESRSSVNASFGMEYDLSDFIKGLSTKLITSFDTKSVNYLTGNRDYQYWEQIIDPNLQGADGRDSITYHRIRSDFDNTPLSVSKGATFQSFYEVQYQINYNRVFDDRHAFTGLFLAQQQSLIKANEPLPFNVRGLATRLSYAYDNRYILEFNAGYNGSEQFAPKNRYGFFPSVSAAWNISNEKFFEHFGKTMDRLKLRTSYGMVGNDKMGETRFLYLDNIKRPGGGYSTLISNNHTIAESFFGNPDLKWETAKKLNIGVEIGLFKSLNLTVDIFDEKRDNILISKQSTPQLVGVVSSTIAPFNFGKVKNKGYEIEATYTKSITKDLFVVAKGNINYNDNKVLYMDELKLDSTYAYQYRQTGYSIGQQWGLNALGFFKDQAEIDSYARYDGVQPRPGDLKFEDLNGDNIINEKDLMPVGYSDVPKYTWGLALSMTYKNIDISGLLQGAFKVSGILSGNGPWEWYDFRNYHMKAWTPERAASGEKILFPALSQSQSASELRGSTFFNQDRSFIRLKNLEIGYNLPKKWCTFINAKSVRVYTNGYNLLTRDKLKFKDWDPEVTSNTIYPVLKVINFGANITF